MVLIGALDIVSCGVPWRLVPLMSRDFIMSDPYLKDRVAVSGCLDKSFLYKCDQEHLNRLAIVAHSVGMSRSEYIRMLIDQEYNRL